MLGLAFVTLVATTSVYFASRPTLAGQPSLWLSLFLAQLPLALYAGYLLHRHNELKLRLGPKPGDVLRGVSLAAILILAIWSGRALLMPHGSEREAWLARLYIHLGDPALLERIWWMPLIVVGSAIADEVLFRAWLQPKVIEKFGVSRGLIITAVAYAVQALPTAVALRDPVAGFNPLLVILALGTGFAWGYVTHLSQRAMPAIISHVALAYFVVLEFRPGI